MKTNYKKLLKLSVLIVSSLLIATASATIYDYMYISGKVGVYVLGLKWTEGADATNAGVQISGVTAVLTNADPLRLNNTGSTVDVDLLIDDVTGDTDHLESIVIRIYNFTNDAPICNVTVWSGGAKGSSPVDLPQIPANNVWRFQWEITWKASATAEKTVNISLRIRTPTS